MSDKDDLYKEIDLIQGCIKRMANNSFLIKGWSLTIVSAMVAIFFSKGGFVMLLLVILMPIFGFWYLDAFFLQTERRYRKLYEWVLNARSIGSKEKLFNLDSSRFAKNVGSIWRVMWSKTLGIFYSVQLVVVILLIVWKLL